MLRKLPIFVLATIASYSFFSSNIVVEAFEKIATKKILSDQVAPSFSTALTGEKDFCLIQSDDGNAWCCLGSFEAGDGFAIYMDPAHCGVADPCPFKVTDVHFYLYDFGCTWPVEIQVNIRDLHGGNKCNGPGSLLCSQTYDIPFDSAYPNLIHLCLDSVCCVFGPFFLEIIYTGQTIPLYPSLVMTNGATNPTDTCDVWFYRQLDGNYHEWYEAWEPPTPGYPVMRITGYTHAIEFDSCWYWKPDRPDQEFPVPSGMPDFGQYQFDDSLALCGAIAITNCLWWFNAVPPGMDPPDFIRLLSDYFHTHPDSGTFVDSIQCGLNRYFSDYGFFLCEHTYYQPQFFEIVDSLKKSQGIILLIGFWQQNPIEMTWFRFGGHYVTMSGVCSESLWVAISDPARDAAEHGFPGRVLPPMHPSHPEGDSLHNNPQNVSHDIYQAAPESPTPGGLWSLRDYSWVDEVVRFEGQNFQPGQEYFPYIPGEPVSAEVEYAVMILSYICGDCNRDGKIDIADVVWLINYLFTSGPPPDPFVAGDTNCDDLVNIADVVYLINYLFAGGPPPGASLL